MAISSKPADIRLEVGVDVDSSFEIFKKDIDELVKRVNAEPRKIKIQLDEKVLEKELDGVSSRIENLRKNILGASSSTGTVSINTAPLKKEATEVVSVFDQIENRIKSISTGQGSLSTMRDAFKSIKPVLENNTELTAKFVEAINQIYGESYFVELTKDISKFSKGIITATQLTKSFENTIKMQDTAIIPKPIEIDDTAFKRLKAIQTILRKAQSFESGEVTSYSKSGVPTGWEINSERLFSVIKQEASDAQLKVLGLNRELMSLNDVRQILDSIAKDTHGALRYNNDPNWVATGMDYVKTNNNVIRRAIEDQKELAQRTKENDVGLVELRNTLQSTFGDLPNKNGSLAVSLDQLKQIENEAPAATEYIHEIERGLNKSLYYNRGTTETPISQIKVEAEEAASSEEHLKTVTQELTETVGSNSGMEQLISKLSEIQALIDSIAQSVNAIVGNKAISEVNPEMTEMVDNLSVVKKLMTDINGENRKIQKAYSKVVGGLKAAPESEANASDLQMLQRELDTYNAKLKELRSNKAKATEEDIQGMHRTQAGINEIISRIQARIDAEAEAAKITNGDALIKRMTDASTAAHKLLDSNINSASDSAPYKQLHANLEEIDTILLDCGRDAEKLPDVLGMSAEEASTKIKTLLQTVSALQNELVYDSKSGTFKNRDVDNVLRQMITLRDKSVGSSGLEEYTNLTQQIEKFNAALQYSKEKNVSLNEAFNHLGTDGVSAIEAAKTAMEALKRVVAETAQAESEARAKASADLTAKWQSQGLTESNIKSLFGKAKNNKDLFEGIKGGFEGLTERYREVLALHEKYKDKLHDENDPVVKNIENRTKALKEEIEAVLDDAAAKKKTDKAEKDKQSLLGKSAETVSRLRKEYAQWTAAAKGSTSVDYHKLKDFADSIDDLIGQLSRDEISPEEIKRKFDALTSGARQSEAAIKSVGKNTQSLGDRVKGLATKFGAWLSISQVVMAAVRAVKKMISAAQEIDAAMTQLKIVTNATDAEMKQFSNTAITLAKNLGKSVTELTKSIETFSRLGYSLKDASELAKYATIMSNVAGVSADEATTGLTSIVKGYNLDVSEAEHVADILVDVGQKYAVSASEMMDAFEKSGAALHATNTSLEKSAGLIASANASVQDSSVIGTALKTVSARVRGKNFCASVHSNMYAQELHVA